MELNKKIKYTDIYEKESFKNHGLLNSLDSIISFSDKNEHVVEVHTKIRHINRLVFNLLIITSISLSIFLCIITASLISKAFEVKNKIIVYGTQSAESIKKGTENLLSLNIKEATYYFNDANNKAAQGKKKLGSIKPLTASLSLVPQVDAYSKTAQGLLESEQSISKIGLAFSEISNLVNEEKNKKNEDYKKNIEKYYKIINFELGNIEKNIYLIDTSLLPDDNQKLVENLKTAFPQLKKYFVASETILKELPDIAGFYGKKNYLLLLENNNELRGGGGFIGSFGIMSLEKGELKDFYIDDVYKLDAPYSQAVREGKEQYLAPPFPMDPAGTGNWALRDVSVDPNFENVAKYAEEFYKKEIKYASDKKYPEDINGVLAITPTIFTDILKFTGPIKLNDYNLEINSDNLLETLQLEVEQGKDKKEGNNPKTILEVLKNELINKLSTSNKDTFNLIIQIAIKNLDEKQALLNTKNNNIQYLLKTMGWSGDIKGNNNEDYLMVVNNNFGGVKSSLQIEEDVKQSYSIKEDGTIVKTLTIKRTHTSDYKFKYIDPWSKKEMWIIGDNNNYIKIYVPEGSKFVRAEGFDQKIDILNENNKTVFGSMLSLAPKQSKTITLSYELPFRITNGTYNIIIQKQPGSLPSKLSTEIINESSAKLKYKNSNMGQNEFIFDSYLNIDRYISFDITKK